MQESLTPRVIFLKLMKESEMFLLLNINPPLFHLSLISFDQLLLPLIKTTLYAPLLHLRPNETTHTFLPVQTHRHMHTFIKPLNHGMFG